ncbi:MAG TPA: AAA domain-containing protein [Tenuifilaceae bacterium]|nr:AAA domain-containing protein [Tenuifilaceae bacterium]
MSNFIERLNKAIDIEYDSKNAEIDDQLKLPIEQRVLKGDTIVDVTAYFEDTFGDSEDIHFTTVKVSCSDNLSKFREGSPVILSGHGHSFELDVLEDNSEEMVLIVGWGGKSVPRELNGKNGWQIDNAKVDIRNVVKKSTSILSLKSSKYNYISDIFHGKSLPKFSNERIQKAKKLVFNTNLNDSQKVAFENAFSTENYYLIQGPPGSGKTWLLAHLAVELAKEGKKVLVTANTHTAINNALQKASVLSKYPHIIKVGKKNQTDCLNALGSTAKNITDLSKSEYSNSSKGIIVGATCYSPHTKKMEFMDWDVVIIDEAGQLSIPLAIAGMVKGEKYILIGDHKQLPPIISENNNDTEFSRSIFEHLFQFTSGTMLDVTYRMNKEINSFPSKQFYNGKLYPHAENENWRLSIPNNFAKHKPILDKDFPEVLYCHFHQSNHSRSEYEAKIIKEFVEEYINQGVLPEDIAVITPFRAQVRQINKQLSTLPNYSAFKEKLLVDVIERIQGQERDIVIYSLATSDPSKALQRADFFFNPNRFNVAITRSKKKRIVIANKDLFGIETSDAKLKGMIKNFKDFYEVAHKVYEQSDTKNLF